jgi:hypothetical protein
MDRESPDLGVSVTAAARRPMAPLPIDSVRRGGDIPPTIAAEEWDGIRETGGKRSLRA